MQTEEIFSETNQSLFETVINSVCKKIDNARKSMTTVIFSKYDFFENKIFSKYDFSQNKYDFFKI